MEKVIFFLQWHYMNFYLHIGVLGAVALNKPTAEPVGKRCTFSALAIIKLTSPVNTIHAMCLLLANDKLFDILAYSILAVFFNTAKRVLNIYPISSIASALSLMKKPM